MIETLHTSLRFYDKLELQNRYKTYVNDNKWRLYEDVYHIPTFQITLASDATFSSLTLVDIGTGTETDMTGDWTTGGGEVVSFDTFNQAIFPRKAAITTLSYGHYYLEFTTGASDSYYSEDFHVVDIVGKQIISWANNKDLAGIYYSSSDYLYGNNLIIDAVVAKPEYLIEEEGTEDGEGNFIPTFQRSYKQYKMWFYAPEWVADAVRLIPLHDTVTVHTNYGTNYDITGTIYDVDVSVEWMENKGLAKIMLAFRDSANIKTYMGDTLTLRT